MSKYHVVSSTWARYWTPNIAPDMQFAPCVAASAISKDPAMSWPLIQGVPQVPWPLLALYFIHCLSLLSFILLQPQDYSLLIGISIHICADPGSLGLLLRLSCQPWVSRPPNTHSGFTTCCYWCCLVINKQHTPSGGWGGKASQTNTHLCLEDETQVNTLIVAEKLREQKHICINMHID